MTSGTRITDAASGKRQDVIQSCRREGVVQRAQQVPEESGLGRLLGLKQGTSVELGFTPFKMEIHVDGRRETLDLQVTLTFQNQRFEGVTWGRPRPESGLSDQAACTSSLWPERVHCVISGGAMPVRRVLSGILLGTLHISYKTTSDYFSQRKLDVHTSLNKNGFYFLFQKSG